MLKAENRKLLRESGLVVYLRTSVSQQMQRLRRDKSRPLLQTTDRKEKLAQLATQRNPFYEELADIEFPAQNRSLDIVAQKLSEIIRSHWRIT